MCVCVDDVLHGKVLSLTGNGLVLKWWMTMVLTGKMIVLNRRKMGLTGRELAFPRLDPLRKEEANVLLHLSHLTTELLEKLQNKRVDFDGAGRARDSYG